MDAPKKCVVVVAEDDLSVLSLLTDTLTLRGYRVLPARDGQRAWETIRQEGPSVVVLDVRMPALDGLEVCRRLRADPATRHIGVIILTADRHHRDAALKAGADTYLVKPFSPRALRREIEALEHRRASI
jgi:DNA-binding response OmpR family regulator